MYNFPLAIEATIDEPLDEKRLFALYLLELGLSGLVIVAKC